MCFSNLCAVRYLLLDDLTDERFRQQVDTHGCLWKQSRCAETRGNHYRHIPGVILRVQAGFLNHITGSADGE